MDSRGHQVTRGWHPFGIQAEASPIMLNDRVVPLATAKVFDRHLAIGVDEHYL